MEDLYITSEDFKRNFDTHSDVDELIQNKSCRILLTDIDDDAIKNILDEENDGLLSMFQSIGASFYSGKDMINALKEQKPIVTCISRALIYLHKNEKRLADSLEKYYGIKCILENDNLQRLKNGHVFKLDKMYDDDGPNCWDDIFRKIDIHPCNSIVLNDHYLGNDYGDDSITNENLSKLFFFLAKRTASKIPLHILVICSDTLFNYKTECFACMLRDILKVNHSGINAIIEFIGCSTDNKLWKYTHDRFVYSNYMSIDASHQLTAFGKGKPLVSQMIVVGSILFEYTLRSLNVTIRDIVYGIKSRDTDRIKFPYKHITIENGSIVSCDTTYDVIHNRLIADEMNFKEGEQCFYLSVPNQNDWINTDIKNGYYHSVNYTSCICTKSKEKLSNKQRKLQDLFKKHCYEEPSGGDKVFWRIIVPYASNLKQVAVNASSDNHEKHCQKASYKKNCFKYKYDAMCIANKIAQIIGIDNVASEEDLQVALKEKQNSETL